MKKLFNDLSLAILAESDLSESLEMARLYGALLWYADVGIYDAPAIENHLIDCCAAHYKRITPSAVECTVPFVHVVSEPLMTGGHTRLMEKLAGMHENPVDLVISRTASSRAEKHVSSFFLKTLKTSATSPLAIVVELVRILSSYQKIILHIHPDDIFSVVACGVVKRLQSSTIYFVNHADHVFSFGTSIADYYFELSSYGKRLDEKKSISGRKAFLGIPIYIDEKKADSDFRPARSDQLLFISAGSDIKYKPKKSNSIFKLVSSILKHYPKSRFVVIGSDIKTAIWWWPLKARFGGRLVVRSHIEFDEYKRVVRDADYYVDSHPIPGGTAFAEQYVSGRRCVGLISPVQGYSPADKLKRHSVEEVIRSIGDYKYSDAIFESIVQINGIENVRNRYLKCVLEDEVCSNLLDQSNVWSGDIGFFKAPEQRADIDVSAESFLTLYRLRASLAIRLLRALAFQKKVKLIIKVVVHSFLAKN